MKQILSLILILLLTPIFVQGQGHSPDRQGLYNRLQACLKDTPAENTERCFNIPSDVNTLNLLNTSERLKPNEKFQACLKDTPAENTERCFDISSYTHLSERLKPFFQKFLEEKKKRKRRRELSKKWGHIFIHQSIHIIHENLLNGIFLSDFYMACLREDQEWFEKHITIPIQLREQENQERDQDEDRPYRDQNRDNLLYSPIAFIQEYCDWRLSSMRAKIKDRYSLMRAYLVILNYRGIGQYKQALPSSPQLHPFTRESLEREEKRRKALFHHRYYQHLTQHTLPGLVKLPPATIEEVLAAEQILDNSLAARKEWLETGSLPEDSENKAVCATSSKDLHKINLVCYEEKYIELLIGSAEDKRWSLPVLGFITSEDPTNEELIEAINHIRKNTIRLLGQFRHEYFTTAHEECNKLPLDDYDPSPRDCPSPVDDNSYSPDGYSLNKNVSLDSSLEIFELFSMHLKYSLSRYEELQTLIEKKGGNPESVVMELINMGSKQYQESTWIAIPLEIAAFIVLGGTCSYVLTPQTCTILLGPVLGSYFVVESTLHYNTAINAALFQPSPTPPYANPYLLTGARAYRTMSRSLLPFLGISHARKILSSP